MRTHLVFSDVCVLCNRMVDPRPWFESLGSKAGSKVLDLRPWIAAAQKDVQIEVKTTDALLSLLTSSHT